MRRSPNHLPFPTPFITLDADEGAPLLALVKTDDSGSPVDGATFAIAASGKEASASSSIGGKGARTEPAAPAGRPTPLPLRAGS